MLYSYVVYWGDNGVHGFNASPCPVLLVGKSRLVVVAVQGAPRLELTYFSFCSPTQY